MTATVSRPKSSAGGVAPASDIEQRGPQRCIEAGDVSSACRMLGRPYALRGIVVPGEGRGSKQTVPTLNLDTQGRSAAQERRVRDADARTRR